MCARSEGLHAITLHRWRKDRQTVVVEERFPVSWRRCVPTIRACVDYWS